MERIELDYGDYIVVVPKKLDLKKVYIEITNRCNLNCKMCFRRFWKDPLGEMDFERFKEILEQLKEFPLLETIYLGGIGEPTIHPDFVKIIKLTKEAGYRLEFGTNGTQLTNYANDLINYGVDKIMVSIDAPDPAIYRDIRGTDFMGIENNVLALQKRKKELRKALPEVGMEIVIMKSNVSLLHGILPLANKLGINHILFSNLMPFSKSLSKEIAYDGSVDYEQLINTLNADIGKYKVRLQFPKFNLQTDRICQFIEKKSTVIRWDGEVAPCYRFLHSYTEYIFERKKEVIAHSFGNVFREKLSDIWTSKEYETFRYIVKNAIYPSCTDCSLREVCDFTKNTEFDCWGNHPSCGDCLWARSLIQCP
ncbi:MAG: tungsten cofactor oxidoreductase radical SAM maturase [Caldisericaceae bacterium]|nr:tungsten cofactor oxidoreductase radical SAM maturase [Caldisericaceae bacterium]